MYKCLMIYFFAEDLIDVTHPKSCEEYVSVRLTTEPHCSSAGQMLTSPLVIAVNPFPVQGWYFL